MGVPALQGAHHLRGAQVGPMDLINQRIIKHGYKICAFCDAIRSILRRRLRFRACMTVYLEAKQRYEKVGRPVL